MADADSSIFKKPDIKCFQGYVYEAQWAAKEWREMSWRCCELLDGGKAQWKQDDWDTAQQSGINPLTINRVFPTVNLITGYQILNQMDIIAKGRTQKDAETSQVMTESIKFVSDQYDGTFLVSQAFKDAVVPGFGCLCPTINSDPRYERVMIESSDWKEIWWDPFSSPWWSPKRTRYVFKQRWMDIEDLKMLFHSKSGEIDDQYEEFTGRSRARSYSDFQDEGTWVEQYIRNMSGADWTDKERKRVRPVELWYPQPERAVFALYRDGRYIELTESMPMMAQYQAIQTAEEVVTSIVKKMRVVTFFGDIELQNMPSPYPHDEFPLVPFVGYIDRYGMPYGVPMQIEGMQEEVNKRRSMAMALLKSRRVVMEKDAAVDQTQAGRDALYEEANKLDGFMVLAAGGMQKFKIMENVELAPAQQKLMESSENEIGEIAGPNYEMMGYESNATSGVAIQKRAEPGKVRIAPLLENLRRSMKILGEQLIANIQGFWASEKVLRITDRMTGAEKFVELNHKIQTQQGDYEVKNNITQGKYDCIVSEAPQTDTVKEKNIELFTTVIQKSPPEIIPMIMSAILELMDLPNKEQFLAKLKPLLGVDPLEEDMSPEEIKQKLVQEMQVREQQQAMAAQVQEALVKLEVENKALLNEKVKAEIQKIMDEVKIKKAETVMNMRAKILPMPGQQKQVGGGKKPANERTGNKQVQRS